MSEGTGVRTGNCPRSLASGKRVQELDKDEQTVYQAWRKENTRLRGVGELRMSDEIGMDFESAVFGVIISNIEDHQKRQACLKGVVDCVRKWGEADQLPIPVRQDERGGGFKPIKKVYVVCGPGQFNGFCLDNRIDPRSPLVYNLQDGRGDVLWGIENPHVEFYGEWRKRKDIDELKRIIASRMR